MTRARQFAPWIIFGGAFVVRLIVANSIDALPIARTPQYDSLEYLTWARSLASGDFTAASPGFKHFTGYVGIFCGFSAIYAGLAQVLNESFGRVILPLGPVKK